MVAAVRSLLLRMGRPAACATIAACAGSLASPEASGIEPLFRFGVIADIQYCDTDDASNFAGSEVRKYRGTVAQARAAVDLWNSVDTAFNVNLGDLIDGQNAGKYGAGLQFAEPQTDAAFARVACELGRCKAPIYHAVGNHELYNFDWDALRERLFPAGDFYFSWRPARGWTCVMLNAYSVSLEQDSSLPGYAAAERLIEAHNPKCMAAMREGRTVDYFDGLDEENLRYVPFNGGLGAEQLAWLRETVAEAASRGDRVVVMSHLPMLTAAASPRTLLYDAEDALQILREEGRGAVVAVLAGHLHRGGYAVDCHGIHHVTLNSPLNFDECFGYIDVHATHMELVGSGGMPSRLMEYPEMRRDEAVSV
jgi:manganese-dependent ADP-ribose/CDP-alcohol diphosphatase